MTSSTFILAAGQVPWLDGHQVLIAPALRCHDDGKPGDRLPAVRGWGGATPCR